jgi:hypothetical protein
MDWLSVLTGAGVVGLLTTIATAVGLRYWRHVVNFLVRRAIKKNPDIIADILEIVHEAGEALVTFSESVAGDAKIDAVEAKKIEKEIGDVKKAVAKKRGRKKTDT